MTASPGLNRTMLAGAYDTLLLDLDGTLVLAGHPIDHAAAALRCSGVAGARAVVVTNNASRAPADVSASLAGLGIFVPAADIITSPQVAAAMLVDAHPAGSRILVVGAQALCDEVAAAGLLPVRAAGGAIAAVVQGYSPDTGWRDLAEACIALRAGADWVATNIDATLPTDRGLLPGNGAMVQALVTATGLQPRVAGKPTRRLLDLAVTRVGASRPLVVGDRLDTDIEAAAAAGLPSLLVLTGVSGARELLAAPAQHRPTYVSLDLRGLIDPLRVVELGARRPDEAGWIVTPTRGCLLLRSAAADSAGDRYADAEADSDGGRYADAEADSDGDSVAGRPIEPDCGSDRSRDDAADADAVAALAALATLTDAAWRTGVSAVQAADRRAERALATLRLA